MRVTHFDWDDGNVEHIARHNVTPEEAEEVLARKFMARRTRGGYYSALGRTLAGRYLFLVFSCGLGGTARVITAMDMSKKQRRLYGRRG